MNVMPEHQPVTPKRATDIREAIWTSTDPWYWRTAVNQTAVLYRREAMYGRLSKPHAEHIPLRLHRRGVKFAPGTRVRLRGEGWAVGAVAFTAADGDVMLYTDSSHRWFCRESILRAM